MNVRSNKKSANLTYLDTGKQQILEIFRLGNLSNSDDDE